MKQKFNTNVDWSLYQKILSDPRISKWTMDKVAAHIFEATFTTLKLEAYDLHNRLDRYESTIIDKNKDIEMLTFKIAELVSRLKKYEEVESDIIDIACRVDERAVKEIKSEGLRLVTEDTIEGSNIPEEATATT